MSSAHSVAIVGGTGGLGQHVSEAFLTTFRASFATIKVLTRDPASEKAQELKAKGAELFKLDEADLRQALDTAFTGTDAIVNVLPSGASGTVKDAVVEAAARSGAKVYFLSDFGSDYRLNDFPGYEHPEWIEKRKAAERARSLLGRTKVIALYTSAFLEIAFSGPFLGFDIANNTYTVYGSPSQKITLTSTVDIGRAVARLSVLALDPASAATVPDVLRIAGTTATTEEIRDIVARVKGVEKGAVVSKDLAKLKEAIRQNPGKNFLDYIFVVFGEGKADFSEENSNELVNPGEKLWKWKTVEDHIREL